MNKLCGKIVQPHIFSRLDWAQQLLDFHFKRFFLLCVFVLTGRASAAADNCGRYCTSFFLQTNGSNPPHTYTGFLGSEPFSSNPSLFSLELLIPLLFWFVCSYSFCVRVWRLLWPLNSHFRLSSHRMLNPKHCGYRLFKHWNRFPLENIHISLPPVKIYPLPALGWGRSFTR